jgi:hypothetical protein
MSAPPLSQHVKPNHELLTHVPPFSIRYFLAWTALTAIALAALTRGLNLQVTDPLAGTAIAVAAITLGWLWFGTLLIVWHAIARRLWRLEPGEWLILIACNAATIWLVLFILHEQSPISARNPRPILALIAILAFGPCALLCLVAAIAQRRRPGWCALFVALTMIWFSPYVAMFAVSFSNSKLLPWFNGAAIMLFAVSVALLLHAPLDDLLRRKRRHWLHYSAIALIGMAMVGGIILLGANSRF